MWLLPSWYFLSPHGVLLQYSQEENSTFKWKIPHGATVHRNKVSFLVGLDLHKVIIIARPTYFEVQYECSVSQLHTPVHMVCIYIHKNHLERSCSCHQISELHLQNHTPCWLLLSSTTVYTHSTHCSMWRGEFLSNGVHLLKRAHLNCFPATVYGLEW